MIFVKNLNFHFLNYGKYLFWSIIIGFAIYRGSVWVSYFTKSFDSGLAMDFKNIYIASKNLGLGKDPYSESALFSTWQDELKTLKTSFLHPPGEIEQPVLYPPWALSMFLPITLLPFETAVILFLSILFISLAVSPWLLQKCIQNKFDWATYFGILLILIAFKGMKMSLLFGQPSMFIFAVGLGSWYFIKKNNWLVAGTLLGISSIKPSISIVFYILFLSFWLKDFIKEKKMQKTSTLTLILGCLLPFVGLIFAYFKEIELEKSIIQLYIEQIQSFTDWFYLRGYDANFYLGNTTNLRVIFTFWNLKDEWFVLASEPLLILATISIGIQKCIKNQWSDTRLLATLIIGFLCFSYHLYYEIAWLVILFFLYKNEMTPPFQWLVFIVCFPDFLVGMEKITPYVPSAISQFLNSWNSIELPIRMISLLVILLIYPSKKQLDFAT